MSDKITELVAKKSRHAAKAKLPKNWKTPAEISVMIEELEGRLEKAEQDLERAEEDVRVLLQEQGLGSGYTSEDDGDDREATDEEPIEVDEDVLFPVVRGWRFRVWAQRSKNILAANKTAETLPRRKSADQL